MKKKVTNSFILILTVTVFFSSCKKEFTANTPLCGDGDSTVTSSKVIATGLNDPRGLKFGPDGYLYVAEAGIGGTLSTQCTQVVAPVGPYTGSDTGSRISRIDWQGNRTTFVDHLPSSTTAPGGGSAIQGMADVQFIGNTLYVVTAGAGCSHGVADFPNGIIRGNPDRSWTMVA